MTVTSLKETTPGKITVAFNDGSEIKSTLSVIADLRLFPGKELDCKHMEEFSALSAKYLALGKASEMLSLRMMSGKELFKKLLSKGYDEATALFCVEKLTDTGLINDEIYSKAISRHYSAKGYGSGRIKSELQRRGISRDLWDAAVDEAHAPYEKIKKFISLRLSDPEDKKQVQKVSAALYRRGFNWDEINRAIRSYYEHNEDW